MWLKGQRVRMTLGRMLKWAWNPPSTSQSLRRRKRRNGRRVDLSEVLAPMLGNSSRRALSPTTAQVRASLNLTLLPMSRSWNRSPRKQWRNLERRRTLFPMSRPTVTSRACRMLWRLILCLKSRQKSRRRKSQQPHSRPTEQMSSPIKKLIYRLDSTKTKKRNWRNSGRRTRTDEMLSRCRWAGSRRSSLSRIKLLIEWSLWSTIPCTRCREGRV